MNMPNGFQVDIVTEPISTIINNFTPSKLVYRELLLQSKFLDDQPFPIIYLLGIEHPDQWVHAVVIKGWRKVGSKTMLIVRNSSKGETVFGQVQQGEHEIEYKVTNDNNAWNLYADMCVYIKMT